MEDRRSRGASHMQTRHDLHPGAWWAQQELGYYLVGTQAVVGQSSSPDQLVGIGLAKDSCG